MSHMTMCDGPRCSNRDDVIDGIPLGWLEVYPKRTDGFGGDFCSWSCVIDFATAVTRAVWRIPIVAKAGADAHLVDLETGVSVCGDGPPADGWAEPTRRPHRCSRCLTAGPGTWATALT